MESEIVDGYREGPTMNNQKNSASLANQYTCEEGSLHPPPQIAKFHSWALYLIKKVRICPMQLWRSTCFFMISAKN